MINRTILKPLEESVKHFPVTILSGPRQVGKSTILYSYFLKQGYSYITLDNHYDLMTAKNDPGQFLQMHPAPLIIDECQRAKELFPEIEAIVNKTRLEKGSATANGMYILSGSSSRALLENAKESLSGRANILRMQPLSMREIHGYPDIPFHVDKTQSAIRSKDFSMTEDDLLNNIIIGGMPQLYDDPDTPRNQFFSDYIETYISKDLPEVLDVKNNTKFENFMMLLASNTGEELVFENYAKQVGISSPTVKEWISSLVKTGIIWSVRTYNDQSVVKQVVKRPKIYFFDTGLACYLAGIRDIETLRNSFMKGRFVETFIANEIRKSYTNNGIDQPLYYYRDSTQNEIDLILLQQGKISFIECKSGSRFNASDIKGFKALKNTSYEKGQNAIICTTPDPYSINEDTIVLPVTAI